MKLLAYALMYLIWAGFAWVFLVVMGQTSMPDRGLPRLTVSSGQVLIIFVALLAFLASVAVWQWLVP